MNQLILAKELLNYIINLQINQNLNDWIYKGQTNIAYSTPTGSWDEDGYLFEKADKSFSYVIRSIPRENGSSYIVIESCNLKSQLYNIDLTHPKTYQENQGNTYLLESYRMTVGKKKKEIDVATSFKALGVTTNEISVINDIKPDWSKTLIDILEWGILREKVKLDLKNNNKPIDTRFVQIIEDFKKHIVEEKTKIKDFSFQKIHPKYVWINDLEKKIGKDGFCHYELITRDLYPNKIFVEIHFDEKRKKQFEKILSQHKDEKTFWNSDHKGGELSLAYTENYDFEDENLFPKLLNALNYLESNFGDLIRNEFQISHIPMQSMTKHLLNQILYGPPGTGKTYNTINKSIGIINPNFDLTQSRNLVKIEFERLVQNGQIVFTTFHQSMSYEDFIEGIKPETKNEKVIYEIKDGVFKKLCKVASAKKTSKNFDDSYSKFVDEVLTKGSIFLETPTHKKKFKVIINSNETAVAIPETEKGTNMGVTKEMSRDYVVNGTIRDWKPYTTSIGEYIKKQYPVEVEDIDNSNKKFVLIIDEINRGNVSQIFGELITLIEDDKRLGKEEALEVILPYSKDKFGVPPNLYIVGTMNTADRSVEALDAALRRRFCFEEMPPIYDLDGLQTDIAGYKAFGILKTINSRIEKLIDKDHAIGHSYLLNKDKDSIVDSFYKNIIPLLQEYFFGDYGKLGLVLGKGFVYLKEWDKGTDGFADFDDAPDDFDNRNVYEIIDYRKVIDYKLAINKVEVVMDFEKAIQVLMNKKFD